MDKLFIIIPSYNEEENIEQVAKEWHDVVCKINPHSRLVIIDDGSKDNTYNLLQTLQCELPQLIPLTKANGGHGPTILYGYQYALEHGADYIFQTDSDGQTLSSEFWQFWAERENYSVLIGNRMARQDGFSRVFVTRVLRAILFFIFGVKIPDANSPYRLMNRNSLEKYIFKIPANFILTNTLLSVFWKYHHENTIIYMPITFRPRQGGINSINFKRIIKIGIQAVKDFYKIKKELPIDRADSHISSLFRCLERCIKKIIPESSRLYRFILLRGLELESFKRLKQRTQLKFEVNVTDHCNLNCAGCEHFSPLAEETFLNLDDFERDCRRLSELTDKKVEVIHLMGGEPLLHPHLIEIINITRKYFLYGEIKIVTNGILIPKQPEKFWETCKKNNIVISITRYPISMDFDLFMQIAEDHNVVLTYYNAGIKTMWCRPLDDKGRHNIGQNYRMCHMANNCIQLRDGKLYPCAVIPYVSIFNTYFKKNFLPSEGDCVDIYEAQGIGEIFNFLSKPVPFCRYCNIRNMKTGLPWNVSKKDISEWL